ncbi:MAG: 23S rRNA (uracil(1939)-C(5))-methyltransferase RlmD [Prevotellaceae bacterium]|nr:23S rRNA (uracil(1939)-C(5))-methyltransferase RlmD [Prevotellaceae bacterium]
MARKKTNLLLKNIKITGLAAEGKAIAHSDDGKIIFVPFAVPGSTVDIRVIRKQRNFMEGTITNVIESSPLAVKPFCEHFGVCGGCKWQNLPYEEQLKYKQQQVMEQLERIGKLKDSPLQPILGSLKAIEYRNKLEYTFSNKRWITQEEVDNNATIENSNALGFHIPKLFDKVLDINTCYLQPEPSNSIRLAVKKFAFEKGYEFFDIRNKSGFLRNLMIRNTTTGEVMVVAIFFYEDKEKREALLDFIQQSFPEITSLMYVINSKLNDSINDQDVLPYKGKDHITETMDSIRFRIGPKSFYQTNPEQAFRLYQKTLEFASLKGDDLVYDLYTGTGTIALFVARHCKKVVGIEYIEEAIIDAKLNAKENGIDNAVFYAGDMKDVLNSNFVEQNGCPDVVILDPPRAGVHQDVIQTLINILPERIVYVSCNPATQARDISLLSEHYTITKVQPVDMFPHTHHVENIVLLELANKL